MRAAIYARYSSENQRDASIDDQVRECKKLIKSQGWKIAETFSDRAISGATHHRPGFQSLLKAARAGEFDVLVAEALDRLSRDQEHIAGMFKQMNFLGVRVVTISEGEINELHVGLKGTMNALFLKDLAAKIKRGQKGRALQGRVTGSLAYGYRVVKKLGSDGNLERGLREVDAEAAKIINRIFRAYTSGRSAKDIAKRLNEERVPSPMGGTWNASTINGSRKRRDGILSNEMYIGRLIYNRQSFFKDPSSGKRVPRLNPPDQWIVTDAPELRIVSDELWAAAQSVKAKYGRLPVELRYRPKRLFSGLCSCGVCGGAFTVIGMDRMGCSAHRDRGTCNNPRTITVPKLENRILNGLIEALNAPKYADVYEREFRKVFHELALQEEVERDSDAERGVELDRKIGAVVSAIEAGGHIESLVKRLRALEAERADLPTATRKKVARKSVPTLPADTLGLFRGQLDDLSSALNMDDDTRHEAATLLRPIFSAIRVYPLEGIGNLRIEVESQPHMAWLMSERHQPHHVMFQLVAEEGLEPPTPGL
jgi:site-specific DNA recombinase